MINHEEDFDKANLVLTVDTQRGLQSLFDYIIYLDIKVFHFYDCIKSRISSFGYLLEYVIHQE